MDSKISQLPNYTATQDTDLVVVVDVTNNATKKITIANLRLSLGAGLTKETPSGTIDNSNVSFTVAHRPFFINVNGAIYEEGDGLYSSYSAGTITLTSPVGTGGFIKSYY